MIRGFRAALGYVTFFVLIAIWSKHEDDKTKAKAVEPFALTDGPRERGTSSQNVKLG